MIHAMKDMLATLTMNASVSGIAREIPTQIPVEKALNVYQ